ncbi:hypothetical protein V6N11_068060 [Hibiscus sabdariffa]|uniref:Uncharacterized protein n=1 Tax=Hibiscus sabdariffa TaxID=183260 RepID=A0ABR2STK9_9ROSI
MASGCLGWYGPTRHGPGATIALVGRSDKDLGRAWALNGSVTRPGDPMAPQISIQNQRKGATNSQIGIESNALGRVNHRPSRPSSPLHRGWSPAVEDHARSEWEMNEGDDSMEREKWGSARLMDRRIVDRIEDDEDGESKFGKWLQELEGDGG